jgi:hypothetical protein
MGNSVDCSRETSVEHGLQKKYQGDNIHVRPLANPQGELLDTPYATIIFLHDSGRSPQEYLSLFFNGQ